MRRWTFSWSVSDGHGDPVTCTLDVDDNGSVEYTIPNCQSTATQNHSYHDARVQDRPADGVQRQRLS